MEGLQISGASFGLPLLPSPSPAPRPVPSKNSKSRRTFREGKSKVTRIVKSVSTPAINTKKETENKVKQTRRTEVPKQMKSLSKRRKSLPKVSTKQSTERKQPKQPKLSPLEIALRAWDPSRRMECVRSQITVRYNHYVSKFESRDGVLRYSDIDDKWCIGYVFRGDYERRLMGKGERIEEAREKGKVGASYFLGVKAAIPENVYILGLEPGKDGVGLEGTTKKIKVSGGGILMPKSGCSASPGGLVRVTSESRRITEDLKRMTGEEIREGGEELRDMLERRDLEDVLYGGG